MWILYVTFYSHQGRKRNLFHVIQLNSGEHNNKIKKQEFIKHTRIHI